MKQNQPSRMPLKNEKIVITAALPYANGSIHIGHLLEYIQADIYSRFLKLIGKKALYICASDMHGTPIEINAQKAGEKPELFVEKYWKEHQQDFKSFHIEFDNYYKTHSLENKELSEWFFSELKKKDYIYTKQISQLYDETAQRFLPDRYIKGTCPKCKAEDQYGDVCEKCGVTYSPTDLKNPHSTITNTIPVLKKSTHYFFKLSAFSASLQKWINAKDSELQPEMRNWLNEWIKKGLEDWCISRDGPYFGFEIPHSQKETGAQKYFYVWLDAPIGYLASLKNYCDKNKQNWKDYVYKGTLHHFIGKDIAYFHYLFWPAQFLALNIPLPKLTAHGFITVNGEKMSKSRGTFLTAQDFLNLYPAEALRFYYASHLNQHLVDVDVNFDDLVAVNNNVLTGNLGNFCYRVLTFAQKNYGAIEEIAVEGALTKRISDLMEEVKHHYEQLDFKSAVKTILQIADLGNAYFQEKEPWKDKETKAAYVGFCVNIARNLAIITSPILPQFSKKIRTALNEQSLTWNTLRFDWKGEVKKIELLVEKIEKTQQVSELFPLHLCIGEIKDVKDHPHADSLYVLNVDFGKTIGTRQVVVGLKKHFTKIQLQKKKAVFCINMKKAKIRGEESQAMVLVADDGKKVSLLHPEGKIAVGTEVTFDRLEHRKSEVTFEEFKKLKMEVNDHKILFKGKVLKRIIAKSFNNNAAIM